LFVFSFVWFLGYLKEILEETPLFIQVFQKHRQCSRIMSKKSKIQKTQIHTPGWLAWPSCSQLARPVSQASQASQTARPPSEACQPAKPASQPAS
jgi:hypothetical protein